MHEIHGNLTGIRDSVIQEMLSLYEYEIDRDQFLPQELARQMARYSCALNREISLYISRDGDVLDVTVGESTSVPLAEFRLRRSQKKLSRVRCVHTHPRGGAELSDVDITALKSLWLDAMCALGVDAEGHVTGVSAAFLGERVAGEPQPFETEVFPLRRLPQAEWLYQIALAEEQVQKGEDGEMIGAPERALLCGLDSEDSLDELAALCETAGLVVVGRTFQKKAKPDTATYVGSGKAGELSLDAQALEASVLVVDDELTGAQTRNLEEIVPCKVIDRTTLILDIFAQRAKTSEGKLQVLLAQLKYRSSRLIGQGVSMSRLAGGVGTRGPGESKLEVDRRRIRERITELRAELEQLHAQRQLRRKTREKNDVPVVALVGYTNTGKSTLLNTLSGADVYVHDQLFATLDSVSRRVTLPDGGEFLLTDTVGFIRKLPHELIEAFHATLEEAALADVLVIVSDASSPDCVKQRAVVEDVLKTLSATSQLRIDALNKCDQALPNARDMIPGGILVSARTGEGLPELLAAVATALRAAERPYTLLVPFTNYSLLSDLRAQGRLIAQEHEDAGTRVTVMLAPDAVGRLVAKYGDILQ